MNEPMLHDSPGIAQILVGVGELKTSVAVIDTNLNNALADVKDHESRIRTLERFKFTLVGAGTVGGAVAGYIVSVLERAHH